MTAFSRVTVFLGRLVASVAVILGSMGGASADPLTGLSASFDGGKGTLSGYYQTNTDAGGVTTSLWDLTTSTFDCNPCGFSTGFPGFNYTPSTSTVTSGFFFGKQSLTFRPNTAPEWQLSFVIDCGGNSIDCIGTSVDGNTWGLTGFEMAMPDFLPFRSYTASVIVSDPPGQVTFNVAPAGTVPVPGTLLLLLPALAGLALVRKPAARI